MGSWADIARSTIQRVHAELPAESTLAERKAAIDAAYPFGMRAYSPYRTWLRARREYLCSYGYVPKRAQHIESPLERMIRRGQAKNERRA